jgi:transcriptional regulator with XRE-family HTH domain
MRFKNEAKRLGKRIQELRKRRGLRQEDMEEFGIPYKYYQRIESPGSYPVNITLKTLMKIADALEVEVSEFFVFEKERRK